MNDHWRKIRGEIKTFLESNKNENTTYQNLWNTSKAVLRGKFIGMRAYIENKQRDLKKKKKNKTKNWLFEKTNKIDKPLDKLTKRRKKQTQISEIKNKKRGYHNKCQWNPVSLRNTLKTYVPINWKI
jgi:hypothetical protein